MDEQEKADFDAYMADQFLWDLEIWMASKQAEILDEVREKLAARAERKEDLP